MKWSMDTHKFLSETTRTAFQILVKNGINSESDAKVIETTEKELAKARVYKDENGASGRIRRALLTYFKAYNLFSESYNITPLGKLFNEGLLSIRELCFQYIATYRYINAETHEDYYPLRFLLQFLKIALDENVGDRKLTVDDFSRITQCTQISDIDISFVRAAVTNRTDSHEDTFARNVGYDVWTYMLINAGLFEKNNDKSLSIINPSIAGWLLEEYKKNESSNRGEVATGVLKHLPMIACKINTGYTPSSSDANAIAAFVFDNAPTKVIEKYISNGKTMSYILDSFQIDMGAGGSMEQFADYPHIIASNMVNIGNESQKSLGQLLLNLPYNRIEDKVPIEEQKAAFKVWMSHQVKANGQPYKENTINSYIGQMERGYIAFEKYDNYESIFQIQDASELDEYTEYLFNAKGFDEFNDRAGNKACSCGLAKYKEFLLDDVEPPILHVKTGLNKPFSRNRILFGAPGTGKSFTLNGDRKELLYGDRNIDEDNLDLSLYGSYERVTFHPDYSYANFVGTYKPVPHGDAITYEYVPGPFMRVYVSALKNGRTKDVRPFLLIVEEINRANVAAVFGDIFQLLDRDDNEVSEYPIQASEDIKKYLAKELGGLPEHYTKIKIPDNMFIWATMNSADQGVFPMDTAFKRRWNFTYIGINASEAGIIGKTVTLGKDANSRTVEWNVLRKAINERLASFKINEDKLLGPYFLSRKIVPLDGNIDAVKFIEAFKNKVLMYLFDDAAKQKRSSLFADGVDTTKYSSVCDAFDSKGVFVFCSEISNRFQATNEGDSK